MKSVFDFDANLTAAKVDDKPLVWRNAKDGTAFGLYGSAALGENGYCRLTVAERDLIRPLNDGEAWLGEQSAGIQLRFETDSPTLCVRGRNRSKFDMTNMTQVGQCGADLYVYDERVNGYALHEVVRFAFDSDRYELSLGHFQNAERKMRKYLMYLPLYMAAEEFEIGLSEDATVRPYGFSSPLKIAVYGTSVVQGCCASRPGMASSNILSRKLDAEVFNFGFSGCAFMEKEMGEILGGRERYDALIVDVEPNAGIDERMQNNAESFFDAFFARRPDTPVVLFSRILFAMDLYDRYRIDLREYYKKYLRSIAQKYTKKGFKMNFADGSKIFKGNFTEYTVDGLHPTDTGMVALAEAYYKEVNKLLK